MRRSGPQTACILYKLIPPTRFRFVSVCWASQEPDKPSFHLCIVNLVIGTLYCAKGNFEFGCVGEKGWAGRGAVGRNSYRPF